MADKFSQLFQYFFQFFSIIFQIFPVFWVKYPDISSLTKFALKCSSVFPGFPGFPVRVGYSVMNLRFYCVFLSELKYPDRYQDLSKQSSDWLLYAIYATAM